MAHPGPPGGSALATLQQPNINSVGTDGPVGPSPGDVFIGTPAFFFGFHVKIDIYLIEKHQKR